MTKRFSKKRIVVGTVGGLFWLGGCAPPPPPEAPVPAGVSYLPTQAPPKPLPESATNPPQAGPYDDAAIVDQHLPEEGYFLEAYNKMHQPRLAVYVNRTPSGQVIAANSGPAADSGAPPVAYLPPGDYDEALVRTLDYRAIESILSDWMSCGARVHLISSDYLASQVGPEDMRALSEGRAGVMDSLSAKAGADILIQVQAHPTRQGNGPQVRVVAEAIDLHSGASLGSAVADVPLPLNKPVINDFTRFIAGKLMVSMADSWSAGGALPPVPAVAGPGREPAAGGLPALDHLPPVPPAGAAGGMGAASPGGAAPAAAPASQPAQEMNLIP